MKKRIITAIIIASLVLLGGCSDESGVSAEDAATATMASSAEPDTSSEGKVSVFDETDWSNLGLTSALNTVTAYTELDVRAFASVCANGAAIKTQCDYVKAWDASYTIIKEMIEDANIIKELTILGPPTWSEENKNEAAEAGTRFLARLNTLNSYLAASNSTVEDEVMRLIEDTEAFENTRVPGEEQTPVETEPQPAETEPPVEEPPVEKDPNEIDWNDETFLASVEAFSSFDGDTLKRVASVYAAGYQIENECTEDEAATIADKMCKRAASNAVSVKQLLAQRENWSDGMETAAINAAKNFIAFANDFQRYSALASNNG